MIRHLDTIEVKTAGQAFRWTDGTATREIWFGSGDPNGTVTAPQGSIYYGSNAVYRKESASGNTEWKQIEITEHDVLNVAAMLAINAATTNDMVDTAGYTTAGDGGANRYRYVASSSATIDGGFVMPGLGGATLSFDAAGVFNGIPGTGRWIAVDVPARISQWGATGTASADVNAIIRSAATLDGEWIEIDRDIAINQQITRTGDLRMFGTATITCTSSTETFYVTGNCSVRGLTFTGTAQRAVHVLTGTASITDCTFDTFDNATFVHAVVLNTISSGVVDNCRFEHLTALGNTTIGDANGAVRAIYVSGPNDNVSITNCVFVDVNSVNGTPVNINEDADAIHCENSTGIQTVSFNNLMFDDVGKRCIKLQGQVGSQYVISNCICKSGWIGTTDGVGVSDNAMHAFITALGGSVEATNCSVMSGVVTSFVESGSLCERLKLVNCSHTPEEHEYGNTNITRFLSQASGGNACEIELIGCTSRNTRQCVYTQSPVVMKIVGCDFQSFYNVMQFDGGVSVAKTVSITGSRIGLDTGIAVAGTHYAIYFGDGILNANIVGNTIYGVGDGIYLAGQTSTTYKLSVFSNQFEGMTRNSFTNFFGEDSTTITMKDNVPDTVRFPPRYQTLSVGATITYNVALGNNAELASPGAGNTIANLTNAAAGDWGQLTIQGSANNPSWGANWDFGPDAGWTLTTTTTEAAVVSWKVASDGTIHATVIQGYASPI